MQANAYIEGNCVCIVGVCQTDVGPIPFACKTQIQSDEQFPDGPINLAGEVPPPIEIALQQNHDRALNIVNSQLKKNIARDLVLRARAGDQIAMAWIVRGRQAAARGIRSAQYGVKLIADFIKKNPVGKSRFGNDESARPILNSIQHASSGTNLHYATVIVALVPNAGDKSLNDIAVTVANGPALTTERLKEVSHALNTPECKKAFAYGLKKTSNEIVALAKQLSAECICALQTGYALGIARRIQAVRNSNTPISILNKRVAWELGE